MVEMGAACRHNNFPMSVTPLTKPTPIAIPNLGKRRLPAIRWSSVGLWGLGGAAAALTIIPPLYLFLRAIQSNAGIIALMTTGATLSAAFNTILLAAMVTLSAALIGVPLAWLFECADLSGRKWAAILAALPLAMPSYVMAYLVASLFAPNGFFRQALGLEWLPNIYGFTGAFFTLTLICYPYVMLTTRAGLKRLDPSLVEAARGLGVAPRDIVWRIILPQLRPAVVAGSLLTALYVLRDFGAVAMMRYNTLSRIIYIQYSSFLDRSAAAATALTLLSITAILLWFERSARGKAGYHRLSAGAARSPKRISLGKWQWAARLFVASVIVLALALPASGLIYWIGRGISHGESLSSVWSAAAGSMSAAFGGAALAGALGLPVAILSVRRSGRISRFIEQIVYAGYALPGIVVALALVFLGANYIPSIYQTMAILLAAFVILTLPQTVGALKTALLQAPVNLEEAGRSLGHSSGSILRRITLPLTKHGAVAGMTLAFLTVMKELPATLLLSPIGFDALSVDVWKNISEAFFAQAALPALALICLSSLPLALTSLKDS